MAAAWFFRRSRRRLAASRTSASLSEATWILPFIERPCNAQVEAFDPFRRRLAKLKTGEARGNAGQSGFTVGQASIFTYTASRAPLPSFSLRLQTRDESNPLFKA